MNKSIKIVIALLGISFVSMIVYFNTGLELFPVKQQIVKTITIPDSSYEINVAYVDAGAVSANTIQLRKKFDTGKEEIIKNFEDYTALKDIVLISNDELRVIVGFSGKFARHPDTFFVKID